MHGPLQSRPVPVELPEYGVMVFESRHAPDFEPVVLRNPFHKVLYVLAGGGELKWESGEFRLVPGDVVVVPAGVEHRLKDRAGKPMSILAVCLDARLLSATAEVMPPAPRHVRGNPLVSQQVRAVLQRMLVEQERGVVGYPLVLQAMAIELLVLVARSGHTGAGKSAREMVEWFAARLDENCAGGTIDEVARQLGISRRRFTALFREVTGNTWAAAVRDLRVAHAKRLLEFSDHSTAAVAFECGFEDVATFYRAFKKVAGCTPNEYRRTSRKHTERS